MSRFSCFLLRSLAVAIAVVWLAAPAWAQSTTGDIAGRVDDPEGNPVPGVTVTARNEGTGFTRVTTTDSQGRYLLTQLPPGRYSVSAELMGFSKAVMSNREVNVGTRQTLNIGLRIGGVAESLVVTAEAPLIETTKSDIAGVVSEQEIESLPLLNRTFAGLSITMPEARPVGNFDPTKTRIGNFAMSGGDGRQLDVNVDGGDNKDNVVGSLLQNFAYESIQEFQVLQHRWTAEHGRAVGGVVNVITKSGTNELRGSLFATHRDNGTREKDYFEKLANREKVAFRRQEYGGSIGGPIARDRLFFFAALEKFRERSDILVDSASLPQIAAIPGSQPVDFIPNPYDDLLGTLKFDWHPNDAHSLFVRYAYQDNESLNDLVTSPARTDLTGGHTQDNTLHSLVLSDTWLLGSRSLNQLSLHYQDFKNEMLFPGRALRSPGGALLTFPGGISIGANTNIPQATLETKYQLRNDFTWQMGNHAMKVGGNYIQTELDGFFYFGSRGYTIAFFDAPLTIRNNLNGRYPQGFATPGAVQRIEFSDGEASHAQSIQQIAFYVQDDWLVSPKLTLNMGLRWDANIGNLPDQTTNRTIEILRQLDDPLARDITSDPEKLSRETPSWTEFQPRLGFAYDLRGDARTVVRGGYGIFYDQLFQNLTLFSMSQSGGAAIFQTAMLLTNSAVGQGQLANFRYGVDPLPTVPNFDVTQLARGAFGRINHPDIAEPYVHKFSVGVQQAIGTRWSVSSDYVHTRGYDEGRVQNINPQIRAICDPAFPGSTPTDARCVRGASTRYFDAAFVRAGLPAGRLEQINMIGTTNTSRFDSLTTTLRGRFGRNAVSLSYVLAQSKAWGGQPTASYSGNGIAIVPENQFKEGEWGPTRLDERHRLVASAVFNLPFGFEIAPLVQYASPRPYSVTAGFDLDGDGLNTIDRLCVGVNPVDILRLPASQRSAAITAANVRGCQQQPVNSYRKGYIVNADGSVEEISLRYFNVDMRVSKAFEFAGRTAAKVFVDLYNLFDTTNINVGGRLGIEPITSPTAMQPTNLYGPGFGPPVGRPRTVVFGARLEF